MLNMKLVVFQLVLVLILECYYSVTFEYNTEVRCFEMSSPEACNGDQGNCFETDSCSCKYGLYGCQCETLVVEAFLYSNGMVRVMYNTTVQSIIDDYDISEDDGETGVYNCTESDNYIKIGNDIFPCVHYFIDNSNILGENISPLEISFDIPINDDNKNEFTKYFVVNSSDLSQLDYLEVITTSLKTENDDRCNELGHFRRIARIPVIEVIGNCSFEDPETCWCDPSYDGQYCTDFTCDGTERSESDVCDGVGMCVSPDLCVTYECFGDLNGSCGSYGACTGVQYCECEEDYTGRACNIPICHGIAADDRENVCHGNGICSVSLDGYPVCKCFKSHRGSSCEEEESYYTRAEVDAVVGSIISVSIVPLGISGSAGVIAMVYIFCCFFACGCLTIILVLILGYCLMRKNKDTLPMIVDGRHVDELKRNKEEEGEFQKDVCAEEEFDPYRVRRREEGTEVIGDGDNYEMDEYSKGEGEGERKKRKNSDFAYDDYMVKDDSDRERHSSDPSEKSSEEEEEEEDEELTKVEESEEEEVEEKESTEEEEVEEEEEKESTEEEEEDGVEEITEEKIEDDDESEVEEDESEEEEESSSEDDDDDEEEESSEDD